MELEYSKAIDGISRKMLLYKMIQYGIDGNLYFLIKSLYSQTEACVRINTHTTEWFKTTSGVMQGDSFSPTAFNIFINDLTNNLKELNLGIRMDNELVCILLYADDVVVLANNEDELQKMLTHINKWCKRWKMTINMTKSKVTHFRPKNINMCVTQLYIGDKKLDYTENYKYLSVHFNEFLEFSNHCKIQSEAATRALGALIGKFKYSDYSSYESFKKCFETNINPITDYGSEVWGYMREASTDQIQIKAIRTYLGVHKFAPILALLGDIGWLPSFIRRKLSLLRYWNRLVKMDNTRLTKTVFDYAHTRDSLWCTNIKSILMNLICANFMVITNHVILTFYPH